MSLTTYTQRLNCRVDTIVTERDRQSARDDESRIVSNIVSSISKIVDDHLDVLVRKRLTLIVKDDYGIIKKNAWIPEVEYFVSNVILPNLGYQERAHSTGGIGPALPANLLSGR